VARVWTVTTLVLVLAAGLAVPVAAEEDSKSEGVREVVFGFGGWSLASYNGGVGLRYFIEDGLAVRPGLDFGIYDTSHDETDHYRGDVSSYAGDDQGASVGLSVFLEKYVAEVRRLAPFLALGLAYGYSSWDDNNRYSDYSDFGLESYRDYSYERTEHKVSLIGGFGLRWEFTDRITLGAQYNLTVAHSWLDGTNTRLSYGGHGSELETQDIERQDTTAGLDSGSLLLSLQF